MKNKHIRKYSEFIIEQDMAMPPMPGAPPAPGAPGAAKPIEYKWGVSEGRCPIKLENIIACHNMSLLNFDEFTKILEDNNLNLD